MFSNISTEPQSFREATEDLVNTIQSAVSKNELSAQDKEWLIGELDELINGLKNTKLKMKAAEATPAAAK